MKILNKNSKEGLTLESIENELLNQNRFLFEQSFKAKCNYQIIEQYYDNKEKYNEEMNYSPCFYQIILTSLLESTLLLVSKLYDKKSINISTLLHECKENIDVFPIGKLYSDCNGNKKIYDISELNGKSETEFFESFDFENKLNSWENRLKKLDVILSNLKKQRNKIYAHHDKNVVDNIDSFIDENHVLYSDMHKLISFAFDVTNTIRTMTTGIAKTNLINIDDWENSLKMIQLARKHYDLLIQEELKE